MKVITYVSCIDISVSFLYRYTPLYLGETLIKLHYVIRVKEETD